ncbi:hypothetical protein ANN_14834, partial [Periplaneta americana]
MERVKWTDRIRNEAALERVDGERMMLKVIRKRKRNWLGGNASEMIPWSSSECYPAFSFDGLRRNPEKPQPGSLTEPGFEPGPARFTVSMLTVTPQGRAWLRPTI